MYRAIIGIIIFAMAIISIKLILAGRKQFGDAANYFLKEDERFDD